jgi:hypothetical protein
LPNSSARQSNNISPKQITLAGRLAIALWFNLLPQYIRTSYTSNFQGIVCQAQQYLRRFIFFDDFTLIIV